MKVKTSVNLRRLVCLISGAAMLSALPIFAQSSESSSGFAPLAQWKSAVLAGDAVAMKAFYSSNPPVEVEANGGASTADADVNFWISLKARDMKIGIVRLKEKPGGESIIFKA